MNGRPTTVGSSALDRARCAGDRGVLAVDGGERISEKSPFVAAIALRYTSPRVAEEGAALALLARVERVGATLVFDVHHNIPDADGSALLQALGE